MFGAVVQSPRGSHIEALAAALTRSDAGAPRFRTPLASLSLSADRTQRRATQPIAIPTTTSHISLPASTATRPVWQWDSMRTPTTKHRAHRHIYHSLGAAPNVQRPQSAPARRQRASSAFSLCSLCRLGLRREREAVSEHDQARGRDQGGDDRQAQRDLLTTRRGSG